MFSDRGNHRRANYFLISFINDILLLTAFGLVVFENDDIDDDILHILAYVFIRIVNIYMTFETKLYFTGVEGSRSLLLRM